jgi:hypothetical protein
MKSSESDKKMVTDSFSVVRKDFFHSCHVLSLPIHPKVSKSDMARMKKIFSNNRK